MVDKLSVLKESSPEALSHRITVVPFRRPPPVHRSSSSIGTISDYAIKRYVFLVSY
jgi:hypothetical protein